MNARNLQRLIQKAIAPFLALSLVGYFIYHSIQGDRGVLAWMQLQDQLTQSQKELKKIIGKRQLLEEKVHALLPGSLNRDFLDQQVRLKLGYAHPDEVVILSEANKEAPMPTAANSYEYIYKILTPQAYKRLSSSPFYEGDTRDQKDGFIHLSLATQVKGIYEKYYHNQEVVVWQIPVNKLGAHLKIEANKPGGALYPHYYGSIDVQNLGAVQTVNIETFLTD